MFDPSKDYLHEYEAVSAFTQDYNGAFYHEPWVSAIRENSQVDYNKVLKMTVEELISAGYAEIKTDFAASSPYHTPRSESDYQIIQIHSGCPVLLENITDFDDYLASATTYVWREHLPNGWNASELLAKYDGVDLARPMMEELFGGVNMESVDNLSLSFNGAEYYVCDASIVTERYRQDHYSEFKSPKNVEISTRGIYSSVAQCSFSMLTTTTAFTLNCGGVFACHDVTGLFEYDYALKNLTITGPFRWDGICAANNMFINNFELTSIPYVTAWGRNDEAAAIYNTMYPRKVQVDRGSADFGGCFGQCNALTFLGPRINMNAASICGCTVDGYAQDGLSGAIFVCPELTDVRIINLNNNDWNFADPNGYTYIPKMDATSINFLLNHVADCSATPHTVTFSSLHQGEVSSSAITNANSNGWTVAWQS